MMELKSFIKGMMLVLFAFSLVTLFLAAGMWIKVFIQKDWSLVGLMSLYTVGMIGFNQLTYRIYKALDASPHENLI